MGDRRDRRGELALAVDVADNAVLAELLLNQQHLLSTLRRAQLVWLGSKLICSANGKQQVCSTLLIQCKLPQLPSAQHLQVLEIAVSTLA